MRCVQRLSELGLAGDAAPSADLLVDALRLLLWLCSEQAPPPHKVQIGPGRSVVFGWAQGGAAVEIETVSPGCAVWRSFTGDGSMSQTGPLNPQAVQTLRSLIPLSNRSESRGTPIPELARAKRGRPRGKVKGE